jgi:hypothetical protein
MEIQYAIFCEDVKFPDEPQGKIVMTQPISARKIKGAGAVQLKMPLFVTFIKGTKGTEYKLTVKVTGSSGNTLITKDFKFGWPKASLARAECFVLELPEINNSDTLIVSLILDEVEQHRLKIPIVLLP